MKVSCTILVFLIEMLC